MKRVDVNDAASICALGNWYFNGENSLPHNTEKAIALWTRAAELGYSKAHYSLGCEYHQRGDLKKAKFHFEAAAMAVQEVARNIWSHGGTVRKHGTSYKTLVDCSICWEL